jgi:hypothetical protein
MDRIERSASDDRGCGVLLAGRDERQARLVISRGQVCRRGFAAASPGCSLFVGRSGWMATGTGFRWRSDRHCATLCQEL